MTRPVERAQLICWMKTVKPKGVMLLELTSEPCLPSPNPMPTIVKMFTSHEVT